MRLKILINKKLFFKSYCRLAFILFFLVLGCSNNKFSLKIFGSLEAIDAKVYINGRHMGNMGGFSENSTYFSISLPHGKYEVKVIKKDFTTFHEKIDVSKEESEHYLHVKMEREE